MIRILLSITLSVALAQSAAAALLTNITGPVSVNTGSGFRVVATAQTLKPGDRVMVPQGSSAQLAYGEGCSLSVGGGQVVVVRSAAQACAGVNNQVQNAGQGPGGIPTTVLVVGGVAVAAGAGIAIAAAGGGSDDPPASP